MCSADPKRKHSPAATVRGGQLAGVIFSDAGILFIRGRNGAESTSVRSLRQARPLSRAYKRQKRRNSAEHPASLNSSCAIACLVIEVLVRNGGRTALRSAPVTVRHGQPPTSTAMRLLPRLCAIHATKEAGAMLRFARVRRSAARPQADVDAVTRSAA